MSDKDAKMVCGIVRPIAAMDGYSAEHWQEVHSILAEAITDAGYAARLVSESDAAGVILNSIVKNLYDDPIVVCDVSGKNPNVMFELGMRIAFEKPVIIVTDDATSFSFDISPLKHIRYPQTLRHRAMLKFKDEVSRAIPATIAQAKDDGRTGYLQQFGPIAITELRGQSVNPEEIVSDIQDIKRMLRGLQVPVLRRDYSATLPQMLNISVDNDLSDFTSEAISRISLELRNISGVRDVQFVEDTEGFKFASIITDGTRAVEDAQQEFLQRFRKLSKLIRDTEMRV